MNYTIYHKTGWVAAICYSQERAEKWIECFNAKIYVDKTLLKKDFIIKTEQKGDLK